jgi:hypothetical protein
VVYRLLVAAASSASTGRISEDARAPARSPALGRGAFAAPSPAGRRRAASGQVRAEDLRAPGANVRSPRSAASAGKLLMLVRRSTTGRHAVPCGSRLRSLTRGSAGSSSSIRRPVSADAASRLYAEVPGCEAAQISFRLRLPEGSNRRWPWLAHATVRQARLKDLPRPQYAGAQKNTTAGRAAVGPPMGRSFSRMNELRRPGPDRRPDRERQVRTGATCCSSAG